MMTSSNKEKRSKNKLGSRRGVFVQEKEKERVMRLW